MLKINYRNEKGALTLKKLQSNGVVTKLDYMATYVGWYESLSSATVYDDTRITGTREYTVSWL